MSTPILMRIPVPWVFVLAYLSGVVLQAFIPIPLSPQARDVARVAGFILLSAGVVLAAWALTIFRKAHTTTIPGKISSQLVTWGMFLVLLPALLLVR